MPYRKQAILIIEDSAALRRIYGAALTDAGYRVESTATAEEGLGVFHELRPDLVLLDLMISDRNGLDLIRELHSQRPNLPIIALTSDRSVPHAVDAIHTGAQDVLVKPFDEARLVEAVVAARLQLPPRNGTPGLFIGTSEVMKRTFERLRSAAQSHAPVFIIGDNGTGKALCAQTLHDLSPRARNPFVTVHCAGITDEQMEREFYGYTPNAFKGAGEGQTGAAMQANGGTLYLDDICEMSLHLQAKLLAFLESATIYPKGDDKTYQVDTRIVCGTSCNPLKEVQAGRLREDLFYRLHVVPVAIPPLRARSEDIPALANHVLRWIAREESKPFERISDAAASILAAHPWPGNVRQLINTIRLAVVMHDGPVLEAHMITPPLSQSGDDGSPETPSAPEAMSSQQQQGDDGDGAQGYDLSGQTLAQIERAVIKAALRRHNDSVPRAARELDVAPSTLYRKIAGWGAEG
jgi:DNA-binding NtrC family response regulator